MQLLASKRFDFFRWVIIKVLIFLSFLISGVISDPRTTEAADLLCGTATANPETYIPKFVQAMELLSQRLNSTDNNFAVSNLTKSSPPIFSLAQCHRDLSRTDCLACYAVARTSLPRCLPIFSGRIYLDGCFLGYDNYSFFQEAPVRDAVNCRSTVGGDIQGGFMEFDTSVGVLVENVTEIAARNGGFGVSEVKGVFGLAQCWESLSSDGCRSCLEKAKSEARRCVPSREGRALIAGCYLRYSTQKFYNNSQSGGGNSGDGGSAMQKKIIIIIVTIFGFVGIVVASISIFVRNRKKRKSIEVFQSETMDISSVESLQFNFSTIRAATNDFDINNKLGQGGFGSVYKGRLHNGEEIAVKRLSKDSGQGDLEFKNEVLLVARLQHRNLVRLLGFSLEGSERLLVYEFLPNASLDQFIFDPTKCSLLDWDRRYKIVIGIARGLNYLHEDSRLRIIHRDLKASNVLLDMNMNPKIADFGMARLCNPEETQGSTNRIVGTYGYMAPEYAMHGHFSIKSDVYSFGVLVLEIVTGKKNQQLRGRESFEDLLSYAWKRWRDGTVSTIIDPTLMASTTSLAEIIRCLHIGLLCVQDKVIDRPTMTSVVSMLNNNFLSLPEPLQPAFFIHGSVDLEMPLLEDHNCFSNGLMPSINDASLSDIVPR